MVAGEGEVAAVQEMGGGFRVLLWGLARGVRVELGERRRAGAGRRRKVGWEEREEEEAVAMEARDHGESREREGGRLTCGAINSGNWGIRLNIVFYASIKSKVP